MKHLLEQHRESVRFLRESEAALDQAISTLRDADLEEYAAVARRIYAELAALLATVETTYAEDVRDSRTQQEVA